LTEPPEVRPYGGPSEDLTFDEKLTKDEIEAFYEALRDRDRAIVLAAIAENHLTALLKLLMRRDEKRLIEELFNPNGALGPFGIKIRLAYMLRILPEPIYKDLIYVSKIRNKFAHDLSVKSFDDEQIASWIGNMDSYKKFIQSVKSFQGKHRLEEEQRVPDAERKFRTIAYVLGNSAKTLVDSYRESVRLLIHWIVDYERHILAEEARINARATGHSSQI